MDEKRKRKEALINEKIKQNKQSKKYKNLNIITGVLFGMFLTISVYLAYNLYKLSGIETFMRYSIIALIGLGSFYLIIKYLKLRKKPLFNRYIIFLVLIFIIGGVEYFVAYNINRGLNVVENISAKEYKTYTTSLIALKDGNLKEVKDITKDTKIGRITDTKDLENYVLTKDLMKKDNISDSQIEDYDDSITMLYDLYDKKVDAVFITGHYRNTYKSMDKFANIAEETVELDKFSKKMKAQNNVTNFASSKGLKEPFTVLLMGVDSDQEDISVGGLGDSLMLITFNPETLNATMLSIPRDTYVPITCYHNTKSKITHAASGGDKCMINTISNAFDVDIDYYVKINFRGLMSLVDTLGGIDVEVPYSFCETTLWRSEEYMVYVEEGMQHLNGEQALGLSRNRKTYKRCGAKWNKGERNDFVRGQNQQLVINAIMNKMKTMTSIDQFYNVLEAISKSMTTNMDRKQILSFYNLFKNMLLNSKGLTESNDIINIQKMYLNGSGGSYYDGIMNMDLYEFLPSTQSLNAIKDGMKVNLGKKEEKANKKFSFSADEEYTPKVIGKDLTGGVEKPTSQGSTTTATKTCGTNEELGADKVTCVCKWGYSKNSSGACVKEEEKPAIQCGANAYYDSAAQVCKCNDGYEKNSASACVQKSTGPDEGENNGGSNNNNNNNDNGNSGNNDNDNGNLPPDQRDND